MKTPQIRIHKGYVKVRFTCPVNHKQVEISYGADNSANLAKAEAVIPKILLDVEHGYYDVSLERYKPNAKATANTSSKPVETKPVKPVKPCAPNYLKLWHEFTNTLDVGDSEQHYLKAVLKILIELNWCTNASQWQSLRDKYSKAYYDGVLRRVKRFYQWLVTKGVIAANPLDNIKRSKKTKTATNREPFTVPEIRAIIEAFQSSSFVAKGSRFKADCFVPMLETWFRTGLRPSELIALRVSSIDLVHNTITVSSAISTAHNQSAKDDNHRQTLKTASSFRVIPISDDLMPFVLTAMVFKSSDDYLFTGHNGQCLDWHNWTNRYWKPCLAYLGIEYRCPYAVRHSVATLALEQGIVPTQVANLLGHSSLNMVNTRYAHTRQIESLVTL